MKAEYPIVMKPELDQSHVHQSLDVFSPAVLRVEFAPALDRLETARRLRFGCRETELRWPWRSVGTTQAALRARVLLMKGGS